MNDERRIQGFLRSVREGLADKRADTIIICRNCERPWTGESVAKSKPQMVKKMLWEKVAGTP